MTDKKDKADYIYEIVPGKDRAAEIKHFSDTSYRIDDNDQMHHIWPFKRVHCNHSSKIEIRDAGEMGVGVFANTDIAKDEYLCCYFGKLTHIAEDYSDYTFGLTMPNNVYAMTIDSKYNGNISRYFNHNYDTNCSTVTQYHYENWQKEGEAAPYSIGKYWQYNESEKYKNSYYYYCDEHESTWDKPADNLVRWPIIDKEEPHITFIAKRDIKKDEQLFIDYGKAYWETREKKLINDNKKNDK